MVGRQVEAGEEMSGQPKPALEQVLLTEHDRLQAARPSAHGDGAAIVVRARKAVYMAKGGR